MATKRPYFRKTVVELQEVFEASKSDHGILRELLDELRHREVLKAVLLRTKVEEHLSRHRTKTPSPPPPPPPPPNQQIIPCRKCQTSLRVQVAPEKMSFSCPTCKTVFETLFCDGIFQILWTMNAASEPQKSEMSEEMARRILGVGKDAEFATIKAAWREASKQYHPDKHQELPDRLKKAAELEMKRINEAYQFLQRMTAADF